MTEPDEADDIVVPPYAAAEQLGIADSTLRRLAPAYEKVYGTLPWATGRDGKKEGGGRMWPQSAVERVQEARAFVAAGQAKSLEAALIAIKEGAHLPSESLARPTPDAATLAWEREQIAELIRTELRTVVREELAALRTAEMPLDEPEPRRRRGLRERIRRSINELLGRSQHP